ncbi:rab family protein-like protein, partial [Daphnia pulex]
MSATAHRAKRTSWFDHVDDPTLEHFFSFLSLSDRFRCSLVSQRWCARVRLVRLPGPLRAKSHSWLALDQGIAAWSHAIRSVSVSLADIRTITGVPATPEESNLRLGVVLSYCTSLQTLRVEDANEGTPGVVSRACKGSLVSLYVACSKLGALSVDLTPFVACTNITNLTLDRGGTATFTGWEALTSLPKLRVLDVVPGGVPLGNDTVLAISNTRTIETLRFYHTSLQAITTLTRLSSLEGVADAFPDDLSACPLTRLVGCFGLDGHVQFLRTAPKLRSLILHDIPINDISAVSACRELTRLEL